MTKNEKGEKSFNSTGLLNTDSKKDSTKKGKGKKVQRKKRVPSKQKHLGKRGGDQREGKSHDGVLFKKGEKTQWEFLGDIRGPS